jgi:signal transduction histidine kinase
MMVPVQPRRGGRGRRRRPASLKLVLGGLAAGALILPFALVGVVSFVLATSGREQPFVHGREAIVELEKAARVDSRGRIVLTRGYRPPADFELVIAGIDGAVIYSSSAAFPPGARPDLEALAEAARREFSAPSFFSETMSFKDRPVGAYYAWLPDARKRVEARVTSSVAASLALVGLVAVVFLLGALVAAQLGRAVLRLEAAAGRIAAGDFETTVSVHGIREIEELADAMDGMRATLREDRDQRARFLAAVSHDLRTPLTSIGGYLEAVDDGLADDPAILERYIRIMRAKARLLETRIGGLISFAKMETEEWRMSFEPTDLRPFLEGLARQAREDAILLGIRFEARLEAVGELKLSLDRNLLSRALENVFSNAFKFTPEGGTVRLAAGAVRDGIRLDVDDEGPGIAMAEREKVFEPFYRGSSAREGRPAGEGSGLGLYIARSIVLGHGWTIEADESPEGGGRISLLVPVSPARAAG